MSSLVPESLRTRIIDRIISGLLTKEGLQKALLFLLDQLRTPVEGTETLVDDKLMKCIGIILQDPDAYDAFYETVREVALELGFIDDGKVRTIAERQYEDSIIEAAMIRNNLVSKFQPAACLACVSESDKGTAIDPATIAMLIQLALQVIEWIRNRKKS